MRVFRDPVSVFSILVLLIYGFLALTVHFNFGSFSWAILDVPYMSPSLFHLLGTDGLGRDIASLAIFGIRTSMLVGILSTLISVPLGVLLGALSAFMGGRIDKLVVALFTTLDSIPYVLLILSFKFAMGPGLHGVILAIGLTSWVKLCRLIRGEFLKLKNCDYVLAAESIGASNTRRIFAHMLPNVFPLVITSFGLQFVSAIKMEVIMSYLGLGVAPGTPSWGVMISEAKQDLLRGFWWQIVSVTVLMFGLILVVNLLNDALRRAWDPREIRSESSS